MWQSRLRNDAGGGCCLKPVSDANGLSRFAPDGIGYCGQAARNNADPPHLHGSNRNDIAASFRPT